jgi:hypothetical protein
MHLTTGPGLTSRAYQAGFVSRNIWIPSRVTPQSNARTLCTVQSIFRLHFQPVPKQVPISSQYHASLTGTTVCGYGLCGRGWNCQLLLPLSGRQCGRSRFHAVVASLVALSIFFRLQETWTHSWVETGPKWRHTCWRRF